MPEAQEGREAISDQAEDSRNSKFLQELQAEMELYRGIFERVVDLTAEAANGKNLATIEGAVVDQNRRTASAGKKP